MARTYLIQRRPRPWRSYTMLAALVVLPLIFGSFNIVVFVLLAMLGVGLVMV